MDALQNNFAKLMVYSRGNPNRAVRSRPRTVREQIADNVCSSVRFPRGGVDGRRFNAAGKIDLYVTDRPNLIERFRVVRSSARPKPNSSVLFELRVL